ncbi:hypothetical protein Tco_0146124 [Tanacetum coccineum]
MPTISTVKRTSTPRASRKPRHVEELSVKKVHDSQLVFPPLVHSTRLYPLDREYLETHVSLDEIKSAIWDCVLVLVINGVLALELVFIRPELVYWSMAALLQNFLLNEVNTEGARPRHEMFLMSLPKTALRQSLWHRLSSMVHSVWGNRIGSLGNTTVLNAFTGEGAGMEMFACGAADCSRGHHRGQVQVRHSRNKAIVAKVSTSASTSGVSPDVAELKDMVRALLLDKQTSPVPAPAPVKAVEQSCVTCGGAHSYRNCPATDSNNYRDKHPRLRLASQLAAIFQPRKLRLPFWPPMAKQIRPPGFPPMQPTSPSQHQNRWKPDLKPWEWLNQGELKAITTRSGVSYDGPPNLHSVVEIERGIDDAECDPEEDILLLEAILNSEPLSPLPNHTNYFPEVRKELKICEAKTDETSIDLYLPERERNLKVVEALFLGRPFWLNLCGQVIRVVFLARKPMTSHGLATLVQPWLKTATHANVKEKFHNVMRCLKIPSKFVKSLTFGALTLWGRSRLQEGTNTYSVDVGEIVPLGQDKLDDALWAFARLQNTHWRGTDIQEKDKKKAKDKQIQARSGKGKVKSHQNEENTT